ncbi:MAG: response regulator, partial [Gammaproteobacteria bacterium]|nr:response regulator [Gammaproteobacteria bacterium]
MIENTVLIVDDDPAVLDTYREIFSSPEQREDTDFALLNQLFEHENAKHEVNKSDDFNLLAASGGEEALHVLDEALAAGGEVAVALLDMRMPAGLDGLETAVRMRQRDPNIYIIIVTAYSDYKVDEIQSALQHDFILLGKPVKAEEFRQITHNAVISYYRYEHLQKSVNILSQSESRLDDFTSVKILVVDDDPLVRQYCSYLLTSYFGCDVTLAGSGKEALELVEQIEPELILLDIIMPEMDGFELCKLLKKRPAVSQVPVIFITAKGADSDVVHGFEVGGVDYVIKPFSKEILFARVRTHINLFRSSRHEEELSKNRLMKVMHSLNEGMILTDNLGMVTDVNSIIERMTRRSRGELVGHALNTLFAEKLKDEQLSFTQHTMQQLEQQLRQLIEFRPHYYEQLIGDAPLGVMEIDRVQGEICYANHKARQLLDISGHEPVKGVIDEWVPGLSDCIGDQRWGCCEQLLMCSGRAEEHELSVRVGFLPIEAVPQRGQGEHILLLIHCLESDLDWALVRLTSFGQLFETGHTNREWGLKRADGENCPVQLQGGVYRDELHRVDGGILTVLDLSERKRVESQEQFAAFQAGVAEMSASILHNIGNSVQGVSTGVGQIRKQEKYLLQLITSVEAFFTQEIDAEQRTLRESEILREIPVTLRKILLDSSNTYSDLTPIELVEQGIHHISEIIQVHRNGIKLDQQVVRTNLYQLLDDALMLVGDQLTRKGVKLVRTQRLENPVYMIPRNQLLQALINLVINAADSVFQRFPSKEGGKIEVRIESQQLAGEPWLFLSVIDNGMGIREIDQARILEFGYSTKKRGSGFGLHATANFLKMLNGKVV